MGKRATILILTLLLVSGCAGEQTATLPPVTAEPALTLTIGSATTIAALSTMPATDTPSPNSTQPAGLVFPTPLPAITVSPSATPQLSPALSAAAIQVLSPGPLSKVLSPITMRAYIVPGAFDMVTVELYGEDDRLIFRKLMRMYSEYKWAYFTLDIPFETHAAAELGRLQVSTQDEGGNLTALLGVRLVLQPQGFDEINPSGDLAERCSLLTPLPSMEANGGSLSVGGSYRPFNTQPLILELVGSDGSILASRWVEVPARLDDGRMLFGEDLIYSVEAPTHARLVARQFDDRIAGNTYLFSQEILVNP